MNLLTFVVLLSFKQLFRETSFILTAHRGKFP